MFLKQEPLERNTEYLDNYCKSMGDNPKLPDIIPVSQRRIKYYVNSGKFSFSRQHNNKCY